MLHWRLLLLLAIALPACSQPLTRQNVSAILGFENGQAGVFPPGWFLSSGGGPATAIAIDDKIFHSGKYSARIERTAASAGAVTGVIASIPVDFTGKTIEWRGFIKLENVSDFVAIWIREDGTTPPPPSLAFSTLQSQGVKGTADWKEYSITVPVVREAKQLVFGFFVQGTGRAWFDDLRLLVDGKPIEQAPAPVLTPLDIDHEFDGGSGISLTELSETQVKNLAVLAKVWGFLKYHHPSVMFGGHHWDYDLFRILPQVLGAKDSAAAGAAISGWIADLGPVAKCTLCAKLDPNGLALAPDLDWISDQSLLGAGLSQALHSIYENRIPTAKGFYISLDPNISNPVFENELSYPTIKLPDAGFQLLALFRFWNMVQYFHPDRDVMADDPANAREYWSQVLEQSIPRIALANDRLTYQQELMRFIAGIHDTHANLWSSLAARPPIGVCQLPVDVRFIEGQPVVSQYTSISAGFGSGLKIGDILAEIDGVAVDGLLEQWRPFYADSNEAARLRDIGQSITRGPCGEVSLLVRRGGAAMNLKTTRVPLTSLNLAPASTHDRGGNAFELLSKDVAYLKLSAVMSAASANYIQSAAGTKGLIVDIRNYPHEFVVFTLGSLLASQPVDFARFTQADVTNPGAFHWGDIARHTPKSPHYSGKVVILVDELSQSQAEYTAMAFRSVPGAIVVGSTTAGADGTVSEVPLPGGLASYISGLGVFYPDKRPTQRIGIIPDIEVKPTIAGLLAGRDEQLEEAIRLITGALPPPTKANLLPQPVTPGASLLNIPVNVLGSALGGAGVVGTVQSGALRKQAALTSTSPAGDQTTLWWYLQLPASPNLGLSFSAIYTNPPASQLSVRVNGTKFWQYNPALLTAAEVSGFGTAPWQYGFVDLSPWSGQTIALELVSDSRGLSNFQFYFSAWAELLLSPASDANCGSTLSSSGPINAPSAGSSGSISVTAGATCSWMAAGQADWVTVGRSSAAGVGIVEYTIAPNTGPSRESSLVVAGRLITVAQEGVN